MESAQKEEWSGSIDRVILGATRAEGGTRTRSYAIGGESGLAFLSEPPAGNPLPLIALEICDDIDLWPAIVTDYVGDTARDPPAWAAAAEKEYGADLVRLYLTSTRRRGFGDFASLRRTVEAVLSATGLPLIIEGSDEPSIDSEVFRTCAEAGEGERLLLGTAEADRYRSVAAAALAYNHALIAQSPIDINLAKQLNILLREIGVPHDRIVIDPYTGALGYGFEYSYSVMERIRHAALKGDADLAMPMISSAIDSMNVKEVREAADRMEMAVNWEFYTCFSAAVAGADIVCVRHPATIPRLKESFAALRGASVPKEGEPWP
ncbi:MAG: acetyl-CoA decarbonylase/synthase complex subunit delta [Methanomicrobiales archaeon]|nr:acetyl-CoA decarbonylase/synthase complex subunit delta [Methanomicrobiales archaeon]MDI6876568.1 acetyl-CoA decarbonylase/synthase complex subunit delta [Methanomicrobiales archaeon]